MELMKKHKMHILLPVLLVVLSLVGSLVYTAFHSGGSAKSHVSLGQQYLNKLDYSAAVLEFSNAIALDPTNKEARIGLAQAYTQTGNYSFAAEVLEDVIDEDSLDPDLTQALIHVYEEGGKPGAAIHLIVELIRQTDEETYYDQLQEAIALLYSTPHSYAVGTDQVMRLSGGDVQSRGSNTLGQLGTDWSLGSRDAVQSDFAAAGFPGNALSVYCAGRTSYVIDENHDLWAAGENRWGQMGLSYGTTLPESGWVRLTDTGDVAAVAGTSGTLMILKLDGTLWLSGSGNGQILTRSTQFGTVIRICSVQGYNYVLTGEGKLYYEYPSGASGVWNRLASDVIDFSAQGSSVIWMNSDGNLYSNYGFSYPSDWTWMEDGSIQPGFAIREFAYNGTHLVLLGMDGTLYQVDYDGNLAEVQTDSPVVTVFTEKGNAVAVLENGTILCWEANSDGYLTV